MTNLLIFVDSERPDTYLNSIIYNMRTKSIRKVTFVHVSDFVNSPSHQSKRGLASRTLASVRKMIELLARHGKYIHQNGKLVILDEKNGILSNNEVREFYSQTEEASTAYESEDISYKDLRQYVQDFIKNNKEYVIDVTGLRKIFLGDLTALGLVDGVSGLYTFDLIKKADYSNPWKNLLHDLDRSSHLCYEYVNVLETKIFSECSRAVFIRSPRFKYAFFLVVAFIALGIGLNAYCGLDSNISKWINVISQFATLAALFFVFFPPRNI